MNHATPRPKHLSDLPINPDLRRRLLALHANHITIHQALDAWRYQDLPAADALALAAITLADANRCLTAQLLDLLQRSPPTTQILPVS